MTTQEHLPQPSARVELVDQDGLVARQLVPDDDQSYFDALHHDPSRFQYGEEATLTKYPTVESVRASIEDPDPRKLRLGVWDGSTMTASVNLTFKRPGVAELGYWSGYGGHDYSERGSRLLLDYAFGTLGLRQVTAWAAVENEGSQLILERLGFQRQTNGEHQVRYVLDNPATSAGSTESVTS